MSKLRTIEDHFSYISKNGHRKYLSLINSEIKKITDSNFSSELIVNDSNSIIFGIKDNFSIKNHFTTASTNILGNYKSPYDSDIVKIFFNNGYKNVLKTNLDELAMGGTGLFSNQGIIRNALNNDYISSGSSSGSAVAVAKKIVPFAIGSDTGDSVIKPAAYNKIIGFKPSWGIVSRYGLFDYSPSLDHVGWFSNSLNDSFNLLKILAVKQNKDQTNVNFKKNITDYKKSKTKKLVVLKNIENWIDDKDILNNYLKNKNELINNGFKIEEKEFNLNYLKAIPFVYQIIAYSESMSCNSNLSGISFGKRKKGKIFSSIVKNSRDFGDEARKRFLIGMFMTSEDNMEIYFNNAKKIRTLIIREFEKILENSDALIIPTITKKPQKISEFGKNKRNKFDWKDELNQLANLTGNPSISVPIGGISDNLSSSITIISKKNYDVDCFSIAYKLVKGTEYE